MARFAYDRLSAQDMSFLLAESDRTPMHVGAIAILEAGALRGDAGGIDIARYRRAVESVLHWIPRYRQTLADIPLEGWPVWIDDRHFDLGYHIRHVSLPRPGTLAQLKELCSRILSRRLERSRPLWEIWVIEGLEGGAHFAALFKVHHCMVDGAAGADLSQILMSASASPEVAEPVPYLPRPAPSPLELLTDAIRYHAEKPLRAARAAWRWAVDPDTDHPQSAVRTASALGSLVRWALQPASETPINGPLSPLRGFDWLTMPLDDVRELRAELDCTVNDVVLATVAGALRRYLFRRRVDPLQLDFRIASPVSRRRSEHAGQLGNHVSSWILRVPIGEPDPLERVRALHATTEDLKRTEAAKGIDAVMAAAEWLPPGLIARGVALARGPVNMIVTNVPGPQFPLYSVGARLLGFYPLVPLIPGGGLGIALFSYEGKLCWGFNADAELVPDLATFVADVQAAFEELRAATVARFMRARTAAPEAPDRQSSSEAGADADPDSETAGAREAFPEVASVH